MSEECTPEWRGCKMAALVAPVTSVERMIPKMRGSYRARLHHKRGIAGDSKSLYLLVCGGTKRT